ncbi:MAG TPA: c-type cytochrome [Bryobacteraceae bacterium]|jgi:photosynthetic reaction center cytochrome c subunit|nr:c-type cytochrome [Bryobacteraceae bacterium]
MQRMILGIITGLLTVSFAGGQTRPEPKPLMSEEAFKNVKVLKGIPVSQFMATMGFFSASLGENCTHCHVEESGGNWAKYADDNANKETARRMIGMMAAINKSYFGGRRVLTCYSCHRGLDRPKVIPNLVELYGPPLPQEADEITEQAPKQPSADQVLDKFIQALGGAQKLAGLTSFVAKGTSQAYGETDKYPAELFAKAPGQRTLIVHTPNGDSTTTYDGRNGWTAAPPTDRPVPLLALSGDDLDGAKLDAELCFPTRLKQVLTEWRVGPPDKIDNRAVVVVQGRSATRSPVRLFFDKESGLLVRLVRYTDSPVGLNPTQIDYADYREVAGVKMPFRWTVTWLDGRSSIELTEVQPNVPLDAAKFARPAAPAAR